MTVNEFNDKYEEYLVGTHYGLDIFNPKVIEYLDIKFQELIEFPGFKYYQIKLKFGKARFYADGIDSDTINQIENTINEIIDEHN